MKSLSTAISEHINKIGIEPVNIIEVQWVENGPYIPYADKEIYPVPGVILILSNLESIVKLDSQSQSQNISVTLDDTNNEIKDIINYNDVHGRSVRLYQWFDGLPLTERFQLYEGEISSPITWNEGDRTISFNVITKLADKEVGFSPEEADFPFLPNDLVGKPWPMAFGIVQNVPAVTLQEIPITQLAEDLGVKDPTIDTHISTLETSYTELQNWLLIYQYALLQAELTAAYGETQEQRDFGRQTADTLIGYIAQISATIAALLLELKNIKEVQKDQETKTNTSVGLLNTDGFPTGPITIKIGNIELTGTISTNTFNINASVITDFDNKFTEPFGFTFIGAGATVTIKTDKKILYICNIIDSTVKLVQAYRQVENGQVLVTVSKSLYTVKKEVVPPYTFVMIEFQKPLSSSDTTLGDEIFVTLESTIGPNTVDIIIWLIQTYTDLSYDPVSFNKVRIQLEKYPSHFAMLDRRNILTVLEEIAMQARCAIWLQNNVFYIKYLSEEVDENDTITETDIDAGSLILETTQTEELVTKLVATWVDDYSIQEKNKVILRYNVKKYGTREREINFYIYNIPELVVKSATFWLIRLSNIWKIVNFNTYLSKIALETFDTVLLDFLDNYISTEAIKSLITGVVYNSEQNLLNITCWVPIRFGEMKQYDFSWPSQILQNITFPTKPDKDNQIAGGAGPGVNISGDFALTAEDKFKVSAIGITFSLDNQRQDYGDRRPSDLDDVKPVPKFVGLDFTLGQAPAYDYNYNEYGVSFAPPPEPDEFIGATFPGVIKVSTLGSNNYGVDVYLSGLANAPTRKIVIQLQGSTLDLIPTDTWCLVAKNKAPKNTTGLNNDNFEWSMQVPIWL